MKITINYSGMSKDEQMKAALQDCKEYLGERKFKLLTDEVRKIYLQGNIRKTIMAGRFFCGIAGIEGLPVKAIIKYCIRKED